MQRPQETVEQILFRMVMQVDKLEDDLEKEREITKSLSDKVLTLEINNNNLQKKLDNLSAGIGRGLWILGGGFLSSVVAWIAGGGLGK